MDVRKLELLELTKSVKVLWGDIEDFGESSLRAER